MRKPTSVSLDEVTVKIWKRLAKKAGMTQTEFIKRLIDQAWAKDK